MEQQAEMPLWGDQSALWPLYTALADAIVDEERRRPVGDDTFTAAYNAAWRVKKTYLLAGAIGKLEKEGL